MSEESASGTETSRMCVTCGRMHGPGARRCGSCGQSFEVNGSRTRRVARDADRGGPPREVERRPLVRSPGPAVARRLIPRRGVGLRARVPTGTEA
ncbi:MAG: hypothetical protein CVU56_20540 [Deltaproteobacteria bacterium HGW-Deltaproteobacteria-14]|nr:MAG: hypothetical protein CVU56_20540 [Deltaproteobacteria bacterium HGW-Deltaproteobacteria-14]